jgi:putative oxidoreductase
MNSLQRLAFTILRCGVAVFLFIHGTSRVYTNGVAPFGDFLVSQGLPAGHAAAYMITFVEIAGTVALMLNYLVLPLCVWFVAELLTGILMVHIHSGWFVVGGGNNGAEYSVLLILCFSVIATHRLGDNKDRELPFWK